MAILSIDNIKPGMTTADKVVNDRGMVILNPGTTITEALLLRLKRWGIKEIPVTDEAEPKPPQSPKPETSDIKENSGDEIKARFDQVIDNPLMNKLYQAVIEYNNSNQEEPSNDE